MNYQNLITLLLSTIFSLISFIVVTTAVDRKSKKMRDEMYERSKKRMEEMYERSKKRMEEMYERSKKRQEEMIENFKKRSGK